MSQSADSYDLTQPVAPAGDTEHSFIEWLMPLAPRWRSLLAVAFVGTAVAYGATFLMSPTYSAVTSFLPPQQQQSSAASALASLGALAGIAGNAAGLKTPADQYVSLMQSVTVSDRVIAQFKLQQVYDVKFHDAARSQLEKHVSIVNGKRDGLVTVTVEDEDPVRAAAIANQYVAELRRLTSFLAITEAQQRRQFFERLLGETKDKLAVAQASLQGSGFVDSDLKTEPKAAAEAYARAKAETTAAEVKLQTLRSSLADTSPEVMQQSTMLEALRAQVAQLAAQDKPAAKGGDYFSKYREFKYQETLFELMSRQYEIARVDESREGALIQVVDVATPPERNHKPRHFVIAASVGAALFALYAGWLIWRGQLTRNPALAARLRTLRASMR
jgi:capsular polysaccharide biosynthesis protein